MTLCNETPHCIPQPAKMDSHRHCVTGYIIILVCQVILQERVIIESYDFMGRSHAR